MACGRLRCGNQGKEIQHTMISGVEARGVGDPSLRLKNGCARDDAPNFMKVPTLILLGSTPLHGF